jgi:hypothetical protein
MGNATVRCAGSQAVIRTSKEKGEERKNGWKVSWEPSVMLMVMTALDRVSSAQIKLLRATSKIANDEQRRGRVAHLRGPRAQTKQTTRVARCVWLIDAFERLNC